MLKDLVWKYVSSTITHTECLSDFGEIQTLKFKAFMRMKTFFKYAVFTVILHYALGFSWAQGTTPAELNQMRLVKTEPAKHVIAMSVKNATLIVRQGTTNVILPVEVSANRHEFNGYNRGDTNWTLRLIEIRIKSEGKQPVVWHCWEGADNHPHNLRLFTTSGSSYACYSTAQGVKLYRVKASVDSETARSFLLESKSHPDEIPLLSTKILEQYVGTEPFLGVNALFWTIVVDAVADSGGELQVTLHGNRPSPQFVFALKEDQWQLVSNSHR
jgi:hypothetical protein